MKLELRKVLICFLLLAILPVISFAQRDFSEIKTLIKTNKYDAAETLLTNLLAEIPPTDSTDFTDTKRLYAMLFYRKKDYPKSIEIYSELLNYLPSESHRRGDFQFAVGESYLRIADYENFLLSNKNAAESFAKSLGKNSIKYTKALNSLGLGHQIKGEYRAAEKVLSEARKIKEANEVFDIQYSRILNQLGTNYRNLGKFQEAEESILTSLETKEKLKGRNRDYARTLSSYVWLLQIVGRNEEAIEKIEEAISIVKKEGITNEITDCKQTKAGLLSKNDQLPESEKIYLEVLAERAAAGQENSTNYAIVFFDLSDLYLRTSQLEKALIFAEKACNAFEKIHGNEHPFFAKAIRKKADILLELGKTDGIEDFYKKSNEIISLKYSTSHIEYFKSEYSYFLFLKKTKSYSRAIEKVDGLDEIITKHIVDASKYLSIKEIIEVTNLYREYFRSILSLTNLNPDNRVLTEKSFDCSIFYKSYVLKAMLSIKKAIKNSGEMTELSEKLTELKLRMSQTLDQSEKNTDLLDDLQSQIDQIEISIARQLGDLREDDERLSWQVLQNELSSDEAAIDFVRFATSNEADFLYAAMILLPDAKAPRFVTLFLESDLTKHFDNKLTESNLLLEALYSPNQRGLIRKNKEELSLYELIWKKIAPELDGVSKVYYICDGVLHNLAIHAISTDLESVVSDSIQFMQMTSFRNLIRPKVVKYEKKLKKALLIGGVKYGELPDSTKDRSNRKIWGDLPWTAREVSEISKTLTANDFSCEILNQEAANKKTLTQKLKTETPPAIIHFATHGYFSTDDLLRVKSKINADQSNLELKKSALVLAGVNRFNPKDAMLSAYEISELDLSNTKLVVLSACETALGQVYEHEGVYGLQRAFKIAGVEYIIMSLWQISDRETKVFMTDFYKNLLNEGLSVPDAFYKTQQKLKENLLDPTKWAGFVLLN